MAFVLPHSLKSFVNTTFLLLLCLFFKTHIRSPSPSFSLTNANLNIKTLKGSDGSSCICPQNPRDDHNSSNLKTHLPCLISLGYINYPFLGYTHLAQWLLTLFYLLTNTASLTRELRPSPLISGFALLSLGNGLPEVFASTVSFRSVFTSLYVVYVLIASVMHICCNDRNHKHDTKEARPKGYNVKFKAMASFLPLINKASYRPRRASTMPDVSAGRWRRPAAVASAVLAPLLIAALWNATRGSNGTIFLYAGLRVLGVRASTLGLTVLAWGNSLGDLIANVGGHGEAQIAISGNYAVPILNTVAGLGSSLVMSAWSAHPMPFVIPVGPELFEILGFTIGGLLWALVILPKRDMKLDRVLGMGFLAIYSCFLSLRLSQSLGLVQL